MDTPVYLLVYLFKIRRHELEPGYLVGRTESMDWKDALYERTLVSELVSKGLILESRQVDEKTYSPNKRVTDGVEFTFSGTSHTIKFPRMFVVAPAGKHAVRVILTKVALWASALWLAQKVPYLFEQALRLLQAFFRP